MVNQIILIGRLSSEIKINDKNEQEFLLSVARKNKDGNEEYQTDIIPCISRFDNYSTIESQLKLNTIIGLKGRIEMIDNQISIIVEKLTFLSSSQKDDSFE